MGFQPSPPASGIGWIAAVLLLVVIFLTLLHSVAWTPEVLTISFGLVAAALLLDRWVRL